MEAKIDEFTTHSSVSYNEMLKVLQTAYCVVDV